MRKSQVITLALMSCALASWANAQEPADASSAPDSAETATMAPVGGKSAVDFIRLDGVSPSVPLRNAGVLRQSETVELDGRVLERGKDYTLDYPGGMLLLMTPVRKGQTLRVTYRHDPAEAKSSQQFGQSWNSMKLNFGQGASLSMGLGMAERRSDGTVLRTDLYSLRNNFGLAPGGAMKLRGVFAHSSNQRVESQSLLGKDGANREEGGSGSAIVQELEAKLAGGSVSVQFQSVDRGFNGFSALRDSGFDAEQVNQLAKERGLRRVGFGMRDLKVGGMKLNQELQIVGEKGSSIRQFTTGVRGANWSLDLSSRKVDSDFRRFKDLREKDREQLQRESGLRTDAMGFQWKQGSLEMSASQFHVEDRAQSGVNRTRFNLKGAQWAFGYQSQEVDKNFRQFQGVRQQDAGQLAREQGIRRKGFDLSFGERGKSPFALSFANHTMAGDRGSFKSSDFTATGRGWSYDFATRSNDAGFDGVGRQSEQEQNAHIARITSMYEPKGFQAQGEERHWFTRPTGLTRTSQRLEFQIGPGLGVSASHLDLKGQQDRGGVTSVNLQSGATRFSFRRQEIGSQLVELGQTMGFERERLGQLLDSEKTDVSFATPVGKNRSFEWQQMSTRAGDQTASRKSFAWNSPGTEIRYIERHVDAQFFRVGQLVDPERELLGQMIGQEQRQILVNTMLMRGLSARLNMIEEENRSIDQERSFLESLVSWQADRHTKLQWYRYRNNLSDPSTLLLDQTIDRLMIARQFPGLGSLTFEREEHSHDGETNRASDSVRNTVALETQLDARTSVRTEQSKTQYTDGNEDQVSAHTVSTGLTKHTGVSVTDVSVRRTGDRQDERRRNYGFWLNLGNGVKFTYGYARELGQASTSNSTYQLTGGQVGGLTFGNSGYQSQGWDGQRNRSTGNFQIATSKPLQLGFIRDFQFRLGTDTVRDYNTWQRENQIGQFNASIGGVKLGFDYTSQMHPSGRAVDRGFRFSSPNDPKRRLVFDAMIKTRTLPWGQTQMIRNVNLTARILRGFEITHQLQTNPEQQRGDALLGSVVQPVRVSAWRLTQTDTKASTRFGLSWEERINDQQNQLTRLASVNLTLNANNPSPVKLYYGLEHGMQGGRARTMQRYGFEFSQRPGPNQLLNLMFGNVSWQGQDARHMRRDNWTLRAEYQLRFSGF